MSTKKLIRARTRGAVGEEWLAGKKDGEAEGKESARKWETMDDSVIISLERMVLENFMLGTRPRWGRGCS